MSHTTEQPATIEQLRNQVERLEGALEIAELKLQTAGGTAERLFQQLQRARFGYTAREIVEICHEWVREIHEAEIAELRCNESHTGEADFRVFFRRLTSDGGDADWPLAVILRATSTHHGQRWDVEISAENDPDDFAGDLMKWCREWLPGSLWSDCRTEVRRQAGGA